jgi:hypothetical protein
VAWADSTVWVAVRSRRRPVHWEMFKEMRRAFEERFEVVMRVFLSGVR